MSLSRVLCVLLLLCMVAIHMVQAASVRQLQKQLQDDSLLDYNESNELNANANEVLADEFDQAVAIPEDGFLEVGSVASVKADSVTVADVAANSNLEGSAETDTLAELDAEADTEASAAIENEFNLDNTIHVDADAELGMEVEGEVDATEKLLAQVDTDAELMAEADATISAQEKAEAQISHVADSEIDSENESDLDQFGETQQENDSSWSKDAELQAFSDQDTGDILAVETGANDMESFAEY